jgi:hypothetical protein
VSVLCLFSFRDDCKELALFVTRIEGFLLETEDDEDMTGPGWQAAFSVSHSSSSSSSSSSSNSSVTRKTTTTASSSSSRFTAVTGSSSTAPAAALSSPATAESSSTLCFLQFLLLQTGRAGLTGWPTACSALPA